MKIYLQAQASYVPQGPEDKPACKELAPMLRRRCGLATRMALEACYTVLAQAGVAADSVNILHLSRYGEIVALHELLTAQVAREPLSPTTFSNSVHHTPIGYFSLNSKNRRIGRTLSAGEQTFAMGFVEACAMLQNDATPLLLVYADEPLPAVFGANDTAPVGAWAYLLQGQAHAAALASLELDVLQAQPCENLQPALLTEWLQNPAGTETLVCGVGGGQLRWTR